MRDVVEENISISSFLSYENISISAREREYYCTHQNKKTTVVCGGGGLLEILLCGAVVELLRHKGAAFA